MVGLVLRSGVFSWLGHLPGDLHIERENFRFYFPFTSMMIMSAVVSGVISVARKFL